MKVAPIIGAMNTAKVAGISIPSSSESRKRGSLEERHQRNFDPRTLTSNCAAASATIITPNFVTKRIRVRLIGSSMAKKTKLWTGIAIALDGKSTSQRLWRSLRRAMPIGPDRCHLIRRTLRLPSSRLRVDHPSLNLLTGELVAKDERDVDRLPDVNLFDDSANR